MSDFQRLRRAATVMALFTAVLWLLLGYGALLPFDAIRAFGLFPRDIGRLHGILTAPLIHSSIGHLAANSVPLFVLGTAMLYGLPRATRIALPAIWLVSGLGVWLFGRASFHVGISGVTHGMVFFVLLVGILRRDRASIALVMFVSFLYGGMIWGVLPQRPDISFESHLAGALAGLVAAYALRDADPLTGPRLLQPLPPPAADEDDPLIGDQWREGTEPTAPRPDDGSERGPAGDR
ncbi:rhomboid family intramembrane serine protease [Fontimonas sp. SYSU GA230001]|uniref:rhomboid family intramembrane serine protease n=1 Tax=Fontimonas sp. SYSU GA230001 TaxID=3142450 RepID=UPI0032B38758